MPGIVRISWLRIFFCLIGAATAALGGPTSLELGHANLHVPPEGTLPDDPNVEAIGQLPDGRMLFGTTRGVLVHDGEKTEMIPFPRIGGTVYQVEGTSTGEILIAATTLMAIARSNPDGTWRLELLREFVPHEIVWRGPYHVFLDGETVVAVNATESGWRQRGQWEKTAIFNFERDHSQYFRLGPKTLMRLTSDGQLDRWANAAWQPDRTLRPALREHVLLAEETAEGRLHLIVEDGRFLAVDLDGTVRERPGSPATSTGHLWLANALPNSGYVTVAQDSSVRIFNAELKEAARIAPASGLPDGIVSNAFVDQAGSVWCTAGGQVVRLEHARHLTRFDRFNGLDTPAVLALVRHHGRLHVATSGGIYRLDPATAGHPARFQILPGPRDRTAVLFSHAGRLFAGAGDGIFILQNNVFSLIAKTSGRVRILTRSPGDPDTLYVGFAGGTGILRPTSSGWELSDVSGSEPNAQSMLTTGPGEWWFATANGVTRLSALPLPSQKTTAEERSSLVKLSMTALGQRVEYNRDPQFVPLLAGSRKHALQWWGNTPLVVSARGTWELTRDADPAALLDPATQAELAESRRLRVFAPIDPDRAWIALAPSGEAGRAGLAWQIRKIQRGADRPLRILPAAAAAVGDIHALLPESGPHGEVLWVGGENGLLRVDLEGLAPPSAPPSPFVHGTGDLTHHRSGQPLPSDHDRLGFAFAVPDYSSTGQIAYRSRLVSDGEGEWSPYSLLPNRELGHLARGDYRFEVQARNADGLASPITVQQFTVAPPWWTAAWVWLAGFGALLAVFVIGAQWMSRRQRRDQSRLEALIAERTAELRANQEQLSLAKDEAESASHAKSTFLASMSHELRTPLNAILGFARILQRETGLSAKGRAQLGTIDRNGQHLLETINEVLDISKIEAGEIALHATPCTLARLLSDLTDLLEPRAAQKQISLRIELGSDLPRRVMVDVARLRQVLINLLGNAVKFTAAGEIVLRCRATADQRVRFEVSDTGPGIAPEDLERIFRPFHQARAGVRQSGTGLGLAISQRLVELMGGRIHVSSTPGRGSCFAFDLAMPPAVADSRHPFTAREVAGYRGPRRRLLAIDDEATNLELLVELLTPLGFEIATAPATAAAGLILKTTVIDAVLIDIRLPDEDGLSFVRRFRRDNPDGAPPFIAISASVFESDRHEAIAAGCRDFLAKPIQFDSLLDTLGEQLGLKWIDADNEPVAEPAAHPLPRPSAGVTGGLLDLVRAGDLIALRARLIELGPQQIHPLTARHLDQLAGGFDTAALRAWLSDSTNGSSRSINST